MRKLFSLLFLFFISFSFFGFTPPGKKTRKFIDRTNMNPAVKPGDNFYEYVNGNWLVNNPVPASKTRWGSFDILREESSQRIRTILMEAASKTTSDRINQMIGDFYLSGMDSAGLENNGFNPIRGDLQRIDAINSLDGFLDELTYCR